jgi:hypothetical protein
MDVILGEPNRRDDALDAYVQVTNDYVDDPAPEQRETGPENSDREPGTSPAPAAAPALLGAPNRQAPNPDTITKDHHDSTRGEFLLNYRQVGNEHLGTCRSEVSRRPKQRHLALVGRRCGSELQGGVDVLGADLRVVGQDLSSRRAMSNSPDDRRHRDTRTPDAGHTTHDPVVDCDSIQSHASAVGDRGVLTVKVTRRTPDLVQWFVAALDQFAGRHPPSAM